MVLKHFRAVKEEDEDSPNDFKVKEGDGEDVIDDDEVEVYLVFIKIERIGFKLYFKDGVSDFIKTYLDKHGIYDGNSSVCI